MKRAAKLYCGDEKNGVHAIAVYHENNVIDTEIAFNRKAEEEDDEPPTSRKQHIPRIDLACFEEVKGDPKIRLRFWEAKLYSNPEIRAEGDTEARVVSQIRRYRGLVEKHREK